MAKDGTSRGGRRPGQGRPAKALKDKIESGNPGHRKLQVIELPSGPETDLMTETGELKTADLPEPPDVKIEEKMSPREYMEEEQSRLNGELYAKQIFQETVDWLDKTGCLDLIEREVIDLYAMSAGRWIQCERGISKTALLGRHPTTQAPIASPLAAMSNQYSKTMMNCWFTIYQIVKENCVGDYKSSTPQDSVMDWLLSE